MEKGWVKRLMPRIDLSVTANLLNFLERAFFAMI